MLSKSDFIVNYGKIVVRAWQDAEYRSQLSSEPTRLLGEAGIPVGENVTVKVTEIAPSGEGDPNELYERWQASEQTGQFDLLISNVPSDHDHDIVLYDEEVSGVAGGAEVAGCCCPCCTPCCCCGSEIA